MDHTRSERDSCAGLRRVRARREGRGGSPAEEWEEEEE